MAEQGKVASTGTGRGLGRIAGGFEIERVRCASETRIWNSLQANEDLKKRLAEVTADASEGFTRGSVTLLTTAYRVTSSITPQVDRLKEALKHALRLVQPIDLYVQADPTLNAFCSPSRKGTRLVMCLNSSLFQLLNGRELLFVMGHEAAHALRQHRRLPNVDFEHPNFSPLEIVRMKSLQRRQEISCDRVGLLACQDLRAGTAALFKIMAGLPEHWMTFDEAAFARQFDEISSVAEMVDMDDATGTHPITALRARALTSFAHSQLYGDAFQTPGASIDEHQLEREVEHLLSVLEPDLTAIESASEEEALSRVLVNGALLVMAADGQVEQAELDHVARIMKPTEQMLADLKAPDFHERAMQSIAEGAQVLCNKLTEQNRAGLLHELALLAHSAGGVADGEKQVLIAIAKALRVRPELFHQVVASTSAPIPKEIAPRRAKRKKARIAA